MKWFVSVIMMLVTCLSFAQSNCSNPTVVSCGTTLIGESTIGQGDNFDMDGSCVSLNPNNGEDIVYAITPANGVSEITITLDNVVMNPGFPTENLFETYISPVNNCNPTTCFQHTQYTEAGLVNGGTSNIAIFSLGITANGTQTWYIVIDEQLAGGDLLSYDITFDCITGGIHLDTDGCGGDAGVSSTDGFNNYWNGVTADATAINSCGESGTFCTEFWVENPGWEWMDQVNITLGPCWDGNSISNATPTNGSWYEGGDWGVTIDNANSNILWDFTSVGGSGTWGDGFSNNQNCLLYQQFCFDATVLPSCSDPNDLNFTITVTDDGIGGSGATVATFFNYNTGFTLTPGPTISGNTPLCIGETLNLAGSTPPDAATPWTSSNPTVATIDNTGLVTGMSSGVTTITYTDNSGCQVTTIVGVNPSPTVSGNTPLCVGNTVQLSGTGTPDATTPWLSSNGAIASVDNTGLVTSLSAGSTTITYMNDFGCTDAVTVTVNANDDPTFVMTPTCNGGTATISGLGGGTFGFDPDPGDGSVIDPATGTITLGSSGATYNVEYVTNGTCPDSVTIPVTVLIQDDPTFTITPQCDGGTSIVTGTPGGTFSFETPPVDAAVIDPVTGTVSGGTSGNSYDVEYVTNGPCPDSMVVQVIATNGDDPTFSLTPTCNGGTAIVTGTPGGTFGFDTPPGDGATIDPVTGTIINGTPGATYDVEYVTNGVCSDSLVQQVTALAQDDPTFTLTPTCDGATVIVTGTVGGGFSFNPPPGDGAVIDPVTGEVSSVNPGTTYNVQYLTSGICPDSSTISFESLPLDDPSFVLTPTCDGAVVSSAATPGGTYSFNATPVDAAVIDPTSGSISGGTPGSTYDVLYITAGICPASTTQMVTAYSLPSAPVTSPDMQYCSSDDFANMTVSGSGGIFTWYLSPPPANAIATGAAVPPSNENGATTYYVTETINNCEGEASMIVITILDCEIIIPTAFTPDNDLANDYWEIVDLDEVYPNNIVRIYNRWGNLLYESNEGNYAANPWDGKFNGNDLPVGSYYYIIELNDKNNDKKNGTVSIIYN